jgi:uncharacterized membrane protein YdjX (TVP38/TMEM64 family)
VIECAPIAREFVFIVATPPVDVAELAAVATYGPIVGLASVWAPHA